MLQKNRLKIIFIWMILFFLSANTKAQFLDTLVASFKQPHKFFFTVDFSKTFGANNGTDVIGFKLGSAQNQRIYYGLGYYILNTDVVKDKTVQKDNGVDTLVPAVLKLRYFTINAEYIFYRDNHWQFGAPINIGYGKTYFEYYKAEGQKAKTENSHSLLLTLGGSGHYKFCPWVGLGFGLGYATTMGTNKNVDENFNGMTYSFGVKIFFDEIYETLRYMKAETDSDKKNKEDDNSPQPDLRNQ